MCGRYSLDRQLKNIVEALIDAEMSIKLSDEVFPTDQVPVVYRTENGNELTEMTWGWERSFSKQPLINARSAEAWNKKTWANALRNNRCIIPASAFFEWDQNQTRGKRDKYRIEPAHKDGFAFGGLYEINYVTGEMFMSILTTQPNEKMKKIHHRMPVILEIEQFNSWFESVNHDKVNYMMQPVNDSWIDVVKSNRSQMQETRALF